MSSIHSLMKALCPEGVPFACLEDLGCFYGGITGKSKEDFVNGNAKFITYKNVYANPSLNLDVSDRVRIFPEEKQRELEYGDVIFTGSSETPDECGMSSVVTIKTEEKLYLNSFCFVFRFNNPEIMLPDFAKHLFRTSEIRKKIIKTASGVTRYNVSKKMMGKIEIPVPPIAVQREIVNIIDDFSAYTNELTTELTTELEARKAQYQYYLDSFYGGTIEEQKSFAKRTGADLVSLSSVGTLTRGKRFVHADATETGTPCIHYGELYTYYGVSATKAKSFISAELAAKLRFASNGDVVIVGAGENKNDIGVGVAWFGDEDVVVHDACYTFKHNQNPKYISYYLRTSMYHQQIRRYVSEGKICAISSDGLGRALIPIPSRAEQDRIVAILDELYDLCNRIALKIPEEISAREQQYTYYRDLLFHFDKADNF